MSNNPDLDMQISEAAAELSAPLADDGVREIFPVRYAGSAHVNDFRPIKGDPDEPGEAVSEVIDELGKDGTDSAPESVSSPASTLSTGLPVLTTGVQLPAN